MTPGEIADILGRHRYTWRDEYDLHASISTILTGAGIAHAREVVLTKGRIDVLTDDGTGIEVKVDGAVTNVLRQVQGYAADHRVRDLIVATTRATHLSLPPTVRGLPLTVIHLRGV